MTPPRTLREIEASPHIKTVVDGAIVVRPLRVVPIGHLLMLERAKAA